MTFKVKFCHIMIRKLLCLSDGWAVTLGCNVITSQPPYANYLSSPNGFLKLSHVEEIPYVLTYKTLHSSIDSERPSYYHHRQRWHCLSSFFALVCSDTGTAGDSTMLLVMIAWVYLLTFKLFDVWRSPTITRNRHQKKPRYSSRTILFRIPTKFTDSWPFGGGVQNLIPADIEFQTASRIGCLSSAPLLSITGGKWINRQFGNAFNYIYFGSNGWSFLVRYQ